MNTLKRSILCALGVAVLAVNVFAKTINAPTQSLEQATSIAKEYAKTEKIDLSTHFLASVEYKNLHSEYEKPYWRVEWRMLAGTSTGQIVVLVHPDGKASRGTAE